MKFSLFLSVNDFIEFCLYIYVTGGMDPSAKWIKIVNAYFLEQFKKLMFVYVLFLWLP